MHAMVIDSYFLCLWRWYSNVLHILVFLLNQVTHDHTFGNDIWCTDVHARSLQSAKIVTALLRSTVLQVCAARTPHSIPNTRPIRSADDREEPREVFSDLN